MKDFNQNERAKTKFAFHKSRFRDILIVAVLALVLIFAVWKIFYKEEPATQTETVASETEKRVSRLLEDIEGVGEASVMICETEEGVQSVVVVCDGANDLQVLINVREAVSAALGTDQKSIKIYLKKE